MSVWVRLSLLTTMLPPLNDISPSFPGGIGDEMGPLPSFVPLACSPHLSFPFLPSLSLPFSLNLTYPECPLYISYCARWTLSRVSEVNQNLSLFSKNLQSSLLSWSAPKLWDRVTGGWEERQPMDFIKNIRKALRSGQKLHLGLYPTHF